MRIIIKYKNEKIVTCEGDDKVIDDLIEELRKDKNFIYYIINPTEEIWNLYCSQSLS